MQMQSINPTFFKEREREMLCSKQKISPSEQTASCNLSMDPTYNARSALVFKLTNFSKLSIHLLTTDSGSSLGLHAQAIQDSQFIQMLVTHKEK